MPVQSTCDSCGRTFSRPPSAIKPGPTYCSRQCCGEAKKRPLSDIWQYVDIRATDECWEWTGDRNELGYGRIKRQGKHYRATRVIWLLVNGAWPAHLICHHCDNPPCCNPAHLYDGTHADNMRDRLDRAS